MRFLRETLAAAAVLTVYGTLQAYVGARELEALRPTTLQPDLPLTALLGILGFAFSIGLYTLLARAVVRGGDTPGAAAGRGALAGTIAGLLTDVVQAPIQTDFFRAVALTYGVPDSLAMLLASLALVLRPIASALTGALLAWLAALFLAPRPIRELPGAAE
jgi:hypothetical protein